MEQLTIPQILEELVTSDSKIITIDGVDIEIKGAEDGRVIPTKNGLVSLEEALKLESPKTE